MSGANSSPCPASTGTDKESPAASLNGGKVSPDIPPSPATVSVSTEQEVVDDIFMSLSTEEPGARVDQATGASPGRVVYSTQAPELTHSNSVNTEPWYVEVRKQLEETVAVVTSPAERKARAASLQRVKGGK